MSTLKCSEYFSQVVVANSLNKSHVNLHSLNHLEASGFKLRLSQDSMGLCYSSLVSFASALQDAQKKCGSWCIVKGYYACFYAMRSLLAADGVGIAYVGRTPVEINSQPGKTFRKREGHTHEVVYNSFKEHFPRDSLVVNNIGGDEPILWLRNNRETVNYKMQRFADPSEALGVRRFARNADLRKLLVEYIHNPYYAFDPDHASIALPLAFILKARKRLATETIFGSGEQKKFLKSLMNDTNGTMSALYELLFLEADL